MTLCSFWQATNKTEQSYPRGLFLKVFYFKNFLKKLDRNGGAQCAQNSGFFLNLFHMQLSSLINENACAHFLGFSRSPTRSPKQASTEDGQC